MTTQAPVIRTEHQSNKLVFAFIGNGHCEHREEGKCAECYYMPDTALKLRRITPTITTDETVSSIS